GQVKSWPKKGLLSTGSLRVKYAILNRIGTSNWAPTNHGSGITPSLAKLIYLIGTKGKVNFGEYVFNLTMKQAESFAMKLSIAFPSLITEIILSQHPDILRPDEIESKKPLPLSLDYKLLAGKHVPDIVILKRKDVAGTSGTLPKATKDGVLAELMEVSKAL
ncbi:envelope-like protein, partial [Trifolium medium]|nr:envelope-like protein [Trifolium medium]